LELTTKRSYLWYILPLILGLLGGVIAYFVLRKSDPSKAKISLLMGFGITIAYFIVLGVNGSSPEENTSKLTGESQEKDIQATRAAEEAKYQAELERQRVLEEVQYQAELERQRELEKNSKFDPPIVVPSKSVTPQYDDTIVKSFHQNIDDIQALPREILTQCRTVNNYDDYLVFAIIVSATLDQVTEVIIGTGLVMDELELTGYVDHPTVGPKIIETRLLFDSTANCIEGLLAKYN